MSTYIYVRVKLSTIRPRLLSDMLAARCGFTPAQQTYIKPHDLQQTIRDTPQTSSTRLLTYPGPTPWPGEPLANRYALCVSLECAHLALISWQAPYFVPGRFFWCAHLVAFGYFSLGD